MRTRTSPRNQERLWRELGGRPRGKVTVDEVAALERALGQPFLSRRTQRQLVRALAAGKRRAAFTRTRDAQKETLWDSAT